MRSTWLCSRKDVIAKVGVLVAAIGSYVLMSRWPDLLVGVAITSLFLSSALQVLRQSMRALCTPLAAEQPAMSRLCHFTLSAPSRPQISELIR